jgi:uncharacterized protein
MPYPVQHDPANRQLSAAVEGRRSLLDYRLQGNVMLIVHTEVPPPLRNRGIAADLMRAALELARENGWRVRPACSYAAAFVQRHGEYADLIA